jgi:oxalate decarboxylase/phosphoglucose isomerase-like protein (cupin superfamily)
MKHYNIAKNTEEGLGMFEDDRGLIADIFYGKNINHGCIITNKPDAVRGNHYHNHTTQYTYVLHGSLTYYSQPADKSQPVSVFEAQLGDMIVSDPLEVHAMKTGPYGCTFIAFAEGPRGGQDYETDTVRVDSIVK